MLRTAAALGIFSVPSVARASDKDEKSDPPSPYPNSGTATPNNVYFKHIAEFDATK